MSNEKANNQHSWRQKLEDTDKLSSEILQDKNAVWEKLYCRLQSERKKKNILWYWIAAACFLLIALFFLPGKTKKNDQTKNSIAIIKEKRVTPIVIPANKTGNIINNQVEKKEVVLHSKEKNSTNAFPVPLPEETKSIAAETNNLVTAEFIDTSLAAEKSTPTLAVKEKRTLTILHNNELGSPIVLPEINRYAVSNTSHIIFSKQYVYSIQPTVSGHRAISLNNKILPLN